VLRGLGASSRGFYFDLHGQWRSLRGTGRTRFTTATPVTHAAHVAVRRLVEEGYDHRVARYQRMRRRLLTGLVALGLSVVPVPAERASNINVLIEQPPGLSYAQLHDALLARGFVIYSDPATVGRGHVFFATMGAIDEREVDRFLAALGEVLQKQVPAPSATNAIGAERW
jgi:2-aminoethylphosphonate-pyruvate transaminase